MLINIFTQQFDPFSVTIYVTLEFLVFKKLYTFVICMFFIIVFWNIIFWFPGTFLCVIRSVLKGHIKLCVDF